MNNPIVEIEESFRDKSARMLSIPEHNLLMAYVEKGGHALAPETAAKFFQLYLNGSSIQEIQRLNKAFSYESILWSRVKFDWDKKKEEYTQILIDATKEKAVKATLEATSLVSDMILVANRKHGDKLKKYIQTGNEEDLGDSMAIDTLQSLSRAIESLQKITGQDRTVKVDKRETLNVNLTSNSQISDETSATILAAIAEEKRTKAKSK